MGRLYIYALIFSGAVLLVSPGLARSLRAKRGLLELAGVIKCSTGRVAMAYMMYGCYCGLGGQGWPRDKADWCCHKHDCCYGKAEDMGCLSKTEHYSWTCENHTSDCESMKDKCARTLCRCDREAARCLQSAPYNAKYAMWPDFMCGDDHPTCAYRR
ncbi:hypothetical protein ACEWY4_017574 [Coilia grayii]|uniref:Phospholipase A2 n=1 Tax=Coilia grayii TaxID=363190 RepID=A0ABD1JIQ3_9TELE